MTLKVFSKPNDPVLMSVLMTLSVSNSRSFCASPKQSQSPQGLGLNFLGSDFPACKNEEDQIVCLRERCDSKGQMPSHCPCDNRCLYQYVRSPGGGSGSWKGWAIQSSCAGECPKIHRLGFMECRVGFQALQADFCIWK